MFIMQRKLFRVHSVMASILAARLYNLKYEYWVAYIATQYVQNLANMLVKKEVRMTKKLLPLPVSNLAPSISSSHVNTCMSNPYPEQLTFIGQQRAQSALDFSLGMDLPGYNVYVMGEAAPYF